MQKKLKRIDHEPIYEMVGFEQIDHERLCLSFGQVKIEINANGQVSFCNTQAEISLDGTTVMLKNQHSHIELMPDGEININGAKLEQNSEQ